MEQAVCDDPRLTLRGSLVGIWCPRLLALLCLVAALMGILFVGRVFAQAPPFVRVLGLVTVVTFLWVVFRAARASRAALLIHDDRVVFDGRPEGGPCFELAYDEIRTVARCGARITFRPREGQSVDFFGDRLHAEDAFDHLAALIERRNPCCVVLRRR